MLASIAICVKPPPISITTRLNPYKKVSKKSLIQRQRFEFISGKSVSCDIEKLFPNRIMISGSVKTRVGTDDEGVKSFEHEAFIDASTSLGAGGLETTLNKLSKWVVATFFGLIILWRHDAEALWAAMGSILNTGLSTTLKRILNQERPISTLRADPGMPSSHAQSIFYTVVFAILSMVEWCGWNGFTTVLSILIFAAGTYFSWLRVSQLLHTISQVAVGALLGSIFSYLWYWSWKAFVLNAFVSSLLVRIVVVLGAAGFCLCFLIYVFRYWIVDEQ